MDDSAGEIRKLTEKDLLSFRADELSFVCEQFRLPKSGSNAEKIQRILDQPIEDIARALVISRQLRFSEVSESELTRGVLVKELDYHGLPKSGSKTEMLRVLISNGKLNVEELLQTLNVQSIKRVYEGIFNSHSIASENELKIEIVKWAKAELLMSDFYTMLRKSMPVNITEVETPRPAITNHNVYPSSMPPESTFANSEEIKDRSLGPVRILSKTNSSKKLTSTQIAEILTVFCGLFFGGFAIIGVEDVLCVALGIADSSPFIILGITCIILSFTISVIMYVRIKR